MKIRGWPQLLSTLPPLQSSAPVMLLGKHTQGDFDWNNASGWQTGGVRIKWLRSPRLLLHTGRGTAPQVPGFKLIAPNQAQSPLHLLPYLDTAWKGKWCRQPAPAASFSALVLRCSWSGVLWHLTGEGGEGKKKRGEGRSWVLNPRGRSRR